MRSLMSKRANLVCLSIMLIAMGATAQTPAGSISAGAFGSNVGGGDYSFPGNVGIGQLFITPTGSLTSATAVGQSFYTAHQAGSGYAYPYGGMFQAQTDNPNGSQNYFFQGLANGSLNFSVRADGVVSTGSFGFMSSNRAPANNYTNLFLGGGLRDNGDGTFNTITDGGSNYFGAIRMDNTGNNAGAVIFYTGLSTGGSSYTLTYPQLANYARMSIVGSNVGIGTSTPGASLEVNGNVKLTNGSGASVTFSDGTVQSTAWNGVLSGGDYAESVNVSGEREEYEPGDVLVIDPASEGNFLKSSVPYSTAVMGIYSTKPGARGRRQQTNLSYIKDEVPMAMIGIVPTKVSTENGPIHPGDLLVTSSRPGYAMKGTDRSQMLGAVIGKALGHIDSGTGVIEVGVTLQ